MDQKPSSSEMIFLTLNWHFLTYTSFYLETIPISRQYILGLFMILIKNQMLKFYLTFVSINSTERQQK